MFFAMLFCFGLYGFARSSIYVASYAYARFALYDKSREHTNLKKKITFLEKRMVLIRDASNKLAHFEDLSRIRFGLNEIDKVVRKAGVGGMPSLQQIVEETFDEPTVKIASSLERDADALMRQVKIQDSTFTRFAGYVYSQKDNWQQRPSIWPTRGRVTSSYGYRFHPVVGYTIFHEGIDIANNPWTPIFATADGFVKFVGNGGNYGNVVKISHRDDVYLSIYAHLQKTSLVEGQVVRRRDLVGYMGSTGRSTGTHLHYELRKMGNLVNPMDYILPTDIVVD